MRYIDIRDAIRNELHKNPDGLTWMELKRRLDLSYENPCSKWIKQLEQEIGLSRAKGDGRAYIWKIVKKRTR